MVELGFSEVSGFFTTWKFVTFSTKTFVTALKAKSRAV